MDWFRVDYEGVEKEEGDGEGEVETERVGCSRLLRRGEEGGRFS